MTEVVFFSFFFFCSLFPAILELANSLLLWISPGIQIPDSSDLFVT
jgi:hypothetical protein